ncbi:MAG: hypothetical protein HY266_04390 [Deltaproteobacteria bacterium]|nr:hypothetical protein [Deltaproteobacteria bacterium]
MTIDKAWPFVYIVKKHQGVNNPAHRAGLIGCKGRKPHISYVKRLVLRPLAFIPVHRTGMKASYGS